MNIAFIVNRFPSLSETFVLNQITGLIDRGHHVDIYATYLPNENVQHSDVARYGLLENTTYLCDGKANVERGRRLLFSLTVFRLLLTRLYKKPGLLFQIFNALGYGKNASLVKMLHKACNLLNERSYDVVQCHFGPKGSSGALLRDVGAVKGKIITTFHGNDISTYIKKNGKSAYDYLFRKGDLFTPISERWKGELIKLGCSEKKIVVHRMGVDTSRFEFSPRRIRKDGRIRLLSVARLVEKKGIQYGVQAFAEVLKYYPGLEYTIVGEGPLKTDMEKLISGLNLQGKVKLAGRKSQEEVITLMKETDLFLAPSVTGLNGDQEGIPVVLMEALAQGIPVLTTDHSGIRELVQDGESGFLVPERDPAALAGKLKHLIDHPEMWEDMGKAGRRYIEEHYDINKLNDRLVKIYEELVMAPEGPAAGDISTKFSSAIT